MIDPQTLAVTLIACTLAWTVIGLAATSPITPHIGPASQPAQADDASTTEHTRAIAHARLLLGNHTRLSPASAHRRHPRHTMHNSQLGDLLSLHGDRYSLYIIHPGTLHRHRN